MQLLKKHEVLNDNIWTCMLTKTRQHGDICKLLHGKVQPRLNIVAWFLRSKCTKHIQNVQIMFRKYGHVKKEYKNKNKCKTSNCS